jgi:hypothetical protein
MSEDSSDIEVVYVRDSRPKSPKNVEEFILNELSLTSINDPVIADKLKHVLKKYDIEATDSQVADMVDLAKEKGLQYIIEQCKKSSD